VLACSERGWIKVKLMVYWILLLLDDTDLVEVVCGPNNICIKHYAEESKGWDAFLFWLNRRKNL
jgi:hypothetical protein